MHPSLRAYKRDVKYAKSLPVVCTGKEKFFVEVLNTVNAASESQAKIVNEMMICKPTETFLGSLPVTKFRTTPVRILEITKSFHEYNFRMTTLIIKLLCFT